MTPRPPHRCFTVRLPAACWVSFLGVLLLSCGFSTVAAVDDEGEVTEQNVEFRSYPSGMTIRLEGTVDLNGVTPFVLTDIPSSRYTVRIAEPGFEPDGSGVTILPDSKDRYYYIGKRKSRLKAVARSIVFPGWGQSYANKDVRSTILLPAGFLSILNLAGAAGYYAYTHHEYEDAIDSYMNAKAGSQDDKTALKDAREDMDDWYEKNDDAWDYMRIAGFVYAGVWGISLLDAVLDFPAFDLSHLDFAQEKLSFSVVPARDENIAAVLAYRLPF